MDEATIPAGVLDVAEVQLCGVEQIDLRQMGDVDRYDEEVRRCFFDAHLAGTSAVFVTTQPTIEGHPIVTVWRTTAEGVGHWIDSTRDAYGSGAWMAAGTCDRLTTAPPANAVFGPFDFWCVAAGSEATLRAQRWDEVPAWFLDRLPLPACGDEFDVVGVDVDARRCLHDAVAAQEPAEYVMLSTGDGGEVSARWFCCLGNGRLQAMEVVHQPTPRWTTYDCGSFAPVTAPSSEATQLPTLDDCEPS